MPKKTPKSMYSLKKFPRALDEVPLFPFAHVRLTQSYRQSSSIEEAQFDFMARAGLPAPAPVENEMGRTDNSIPE